MQTTVLAIGRWMPIHLGHKQFLVNLAKTYDRLVIGIGSCYENGTPRNCIPAIEREKLLRKIFKTEGLDNIIIVPVQDRETFEEWFADVAELCKLYSVTHFCTGNKEDILNVMEEKNLELKAELINPEDSSDFPYHATDIRNAILKGESDRLASMVPQEIITEVLGQIAREIKIASIGKGQEFIPGRQTVDIVFVVDDKEKGKKYLLIGKRDHTKIDFPNTTAIPGGGIKEFESPIVATLRCLYAETGIKATLNDNSTEPALITLENIQKSPAELFFTGIYASCDCRINGTLGGGSQCFALVIPGSIEEISAVLHSTHDLEELRFADINEIYGMTFAYDQKRMIYDALDRLSIPYDKGEYLLVYDEEGQEATAGVLRSAVHEKGLLHAASHTYIYKWENRELFLLLQRRSASKDSFPGCLDMSAGGHVEFGDNFRETARKELLEELGINVAAEALKELFSQTIHTKSLAHGQVFDDRENNVIYGLELNCDISSLTLQASEVSEVLWVSAREILQMLSLEESELCTNKEEMEKVIRILSELRQ